VASGFPGVYLALAEKAVGIEKADPLRKAKKALKKSLRSARRRSIILPEVTRLQGAYDWLTGRRASAQKNWQRSLVLAEEMGMRYDLAMTHLEMGRRLNDREHLQKAEAIFAEIGAEWDVEQARRYLKPLAERKDA